VPEAEVEAIRGRLVLVNSHGYYSANPSGRFQKDIETVKDTSGSFPFDDLLSNIKETRGGATAITASHILRGLDADLLRRSGQPYLFVLYTALCLSDASDWEGTLIRELGSESLARHHLFPRSLLQDGRRGGGPHLRDREHHPDIAFPELRALRQAPCRVPPSVRRGAEEALHTGGKGAVGK
jgi:hypothetical protein